jgi:hypothetical protein
MSAVLWCDLVSHRCAVHQAGVAIAFCSSVCVQTDNRTKFVDNSGSHVVGANCLLACLLFACRTCVLIINTS